MEKNAVMPDAPVVQGGAGMIPRATRIMLLVLLVGEISLLVFGPQSKDHLPAVTSAVASGHKPEWWDDAAMGVRYAAWINAGLISALLLTSKWWMRGFATTENGKRKTESAISRWFWPSLIGAASLCLALRLPLASKSLWWDEAWVIMQASHGKWTPDKTHPGEMKFTAHDWKRCAWYYQKPTNHAPMSLLQKATITTWQKITRAKRSELSDLAARVPSLLASCLAVVLLGLLLRAWGNPGAGVCAALVLAIHPWHIRYGVDARAYALVVPLCLSGMLALTRIYGNCARSIWPLAWWGLTEFVWLWAYPNAVFDIAALNVVAAVLLWKSHSENKADRWKAMTRLLVTNVFAAMCFVQMFLPNLVQALRWAGHEADAHVLNLASTEGALSQLVFGAVGPMRMVESGVVALLSAFIILLLWAHASLMVRRKTAHHCMVLLLALSISSLSFAGLTVLCQSYFYPRFIIALLPVSIATVCLAISFSRRRIALVILVALFFLPLAADQWAPLVSRPYAPLHGVASFVLTEFVKENKAPLVLCYGHGGEVLPVYLPKCITTENAAGLVQAVQRAAEEKRGLIVIYGHESFNRALHGDGFVLLDDHSRFETIKSFDGIEPEFHFRILRALLAPHSES